MPKNTIRDILPPNDRPRRRPSAARRPATQRSIGEMGQERPMERPREREEEYDLFEERHLPPKPDRMGKIKYAYYGGGALVVIAAILFFFSMMFGGASLTVTPKQEMLTINGSFTAVTKKDSNAELEYQVMTNEALKTKIVPATGREEVETRASGQIVIYNTHDENEQKLIRNTRFEAPDGKIYRIDKSVVVPGMDGTKPGTLEVTVYAEEPGEEYNKGMVDKFNIPGFDGTSRDDTFYAKSKTKLTGGFKGEKLIVEESVLEAERKALQNELAVELEGAADADIPAGFVSFDQAVFVEYISEEPVEKGQDVEIREKAKLHVVLFKQDELAHFLTENALGSFDGSSVDFLDYSALRLTPKAKEDGMEIMPWSDTSFAFDMAGTADVVWTFDEEKLKADLSGREKAAIHTILDGYPGIDRAEAVIRPFWKSKFPVLTEDIDIEIVLDGGGE